MSLLFCVPRRCEPLRIRCVASCCRLFFLFNNTATTEIYTLSLHDALPICIRRSCAAAARRSSRCSRPLTGRWARALSRTDRKSTRLNSSHGSISYAVFCLKKKNKINQRERDRTQDHHQEHIT